MSATENRVVNMQFNNSQFMKGAADTSKSLADLDKSLSATGSNRGLMDLSGQMDDVSVHASKMSVLTVSALATISAKATAVGLNVVKGLTFDPIKAGFLEYEENLNKLNTIMNATGQSEQKVQGFLTDLNKYSDKTIYSFANMTSSIQKFVNAGVPLPESVEAIKGIANSAAYAGASTEEANRAMFAFSQTMGTGFMMLNDWQQIDSANMGTMQFKQTLIDTAVATGELTKQGNKYVTAAGHTLTAGEGWRDSLQDQWATTEVVTGALAKYTDTHTKLGKAATESATEFRTFSAFMDSFKESIGSGWAKIFSSLIGGLDDATKFWTGFANSVVGVVNAFFNFAGAALKTWRLMGGFEKTIQGFKNLLAPIAALFGAIGDAWRAAFPDSGKGAGKALYGLSAGFEAITRPLQLLAKGIRGLTPLFTILFSVLRLGKTVVGEVIEIIGDLIAKVFHLGDFKMPTGGLMDFLDKVAKAVVNAVNQIDTLIQKGSSLGSAFKSITMPSMPDIKMPKMPSMPSMPDIPSIKLPTFGSGGDKGAQQAQVMAASVGGLSTQMDHLTKVSDTASHSGMFQSATMKSATESVKTFGDEARDAGVGIMNSGDEVKSAWQSVVDFVGPIFGKIKEFIGGITADDIMSSFNMAAFATMAYTIIKFFRTLNDTLEAVRSVSNIAGAFEGVLNSAGNALDSFQKQAQAKLILNIAIAVGILAVSLFLLSTIPADKMANALGGMAGIVVLLSLSMTQMAKTIEKLDGKGVNLKILALSVSLMALGFAMMELALAFKIMDSVNMDGIAKGLGTMFVVMKLMQSMGTMAEHAAKNMIAGAAAIALVSGSMLMLATALIMFKLVDWESMGKAGASLAGVALAVGLLALIPYEGIAKVGVALLAASTGMIAIALALIIFSKVEWESIGKAAVVLLALTIALSLMTAAANPVSAGVILATAAAMLYLSFALKNLNDVEWASIGKLALVLTILTVALLALTGVLYLLGPLVIVLVAFAGAMLMLGAALFLFSAALSIAMALAAGGVAAFAALATGAAIAVAVFMQTLAHEAPVMKKAFLTILSELIDGIVKAVPMVIDGIKRLWDAVMKELGGGGGGKGGGGGGAKAAQMNAAGGSWISDLADGIKKKIPEIVTKGAELIVSFLTSLRSKAGDIAEAGVGVVVSVLAGIGRKIGDIIQAAANLIVKFMEGIRKGDQQILQAGVELIAGFLHDLADTIRSGSAAIGAGLSDVVDAFHDVGIDMVQGMINGIEGMLDDVLGAVTSVVGRLPGWARKLLGESSPSKVFYDIGKFLVQGLTNGIQDHAAAAISATAAMITGQIALSQDLMSKHIQNLDQAALAARAKAEGLHRAAEQAMKAAKKTKGKDNRGDDRAARQMQNQAKSADAAADKAEKAAKAEKAKQDRARKWRAADELGKAKIRSADANRQLNAAKEAEQDAEAERIQANALMRQSRAADVTAAQRQKFRRDAARLRDQARDDAKRANTQLANARKSAAEAMEWQQKAGRTAADGFQEQFDAAARQAADEEAFEKLSAEEKAKKKREEAARQEALSKENLAKAKEMAYKDVERANEIATLAMDQAQRARDLLQEAIDFEAQGPSGQVLNLQPTEAAALAFNDYAALYDASYAAAAAGPSVEFTQNNYSPEALSPTEIYRQSNNLLTYAADKLTPTAA